MIAINNKKIVGMYIGRYKILSAYIHGHLVWKANEIINDNILSCFYNGYWIDEYPWTDDMPWTD